MPIVNRCNNILWTIKVSWSHTEACHVLNSNIHRIYWTTQYMQTLFNACREWWIFINHSHLVLHFCVSIVHRHMMWEMKNYYGVFKMFQPKLLFYTCFISCSKHKRFIYSERLRCKSFNASNWNKKIYGSLLHSARLHSLKKLLEVKCIIPSL